MFLNHHSPLLEQKPELILLQFLEGCIERRPDIMLGELKAALQETCHVEVSESTISRALRNGRGLTRKRVRNTVTFSLSFCQ